MRKILIPLLLLASLSAVAQLKENIVRVDSVNTLFMEKYYPKQLVRIAADSVWYSLTHATLVGQSMQTVKDSGWYKIVGGSGTESDPYYRADTSKVAYLDQENIFIKNQQINAKIISENLVLTSLPNDSIPDSMLTIHQGIVAKTLIPSVFFNSIRLTDRSNDTLHSFDHTLIMILKETDYAPDTLNIPTATGKSGITYCVQYQRQDSLRIISPSNMYYNRGSIYTTEYIFDQYYNLNLEFQSDGTNWYCIRQEEFLNIP